MLKQLSWGPVSFDWPSPGSLRGQVKKSLSSTVHEQISSLRFYAAKSMADDEGRRFHLGWTPDWADKSDRGDWFWGGILAAPHEVVQSPDSRELEVRLPRAIINAFQKRVAWDYQLVEGQSTLTDGKLSVHSVARLTYGFLTSSESYFLFASKVRPSDCRDCVGFAIKSNRNLARCLLLTIEPATQRVSLLNYPIPVDPFWEASVASIVKAALPGPDGPRVAEALFEFGDGDFTDVKILIDHDLVEVFVGEKVALDYRWYDSAEYQIGFVVQEGYAEFENISVIV